MTLPTQSSSWAIQGHRRVIDRIHPKLLSNSDSSYSQRHLNESSSVLPREPVGFKNLLTSQFSIPRATCAWRFATYGGVRPALLLADCWRVVVHRRLWLAPRGTASLQRLGSDGMRVPPIAHDVSAYTCGGSSVSMAETKKWRRASKRAPILPTARPAPAVAPAVRPSRPSRAEWT